MPASGRRRLVWYPLPRRGVRVVDGAALEKRCAKAPRVRIPPSPPPHPIHTDRSKPRADGVAGLRLWPRCGCGSTPLPCRLGERSPSGLWRRTGNAVRGNPSRVRIPPSPPPRAVARTIAASVTRPSCHPTMKYADRDDAVARVWRRLSPNEAIDVRIACPDARYAGSTVAGPAASGHTVVAMRDVHDRLARGARRRPHPLQVPCRAQQEHPAFRMTADTGNIWGSAAEWGSRAFRSAADDSFRRQVERWRTQTPGGPTEP
jgi:hypothetical protein